MLTCVYTSDKNKKYKSWKDGYIKINEDICILYDEFKVKLTSFKQKYFENDIETGMYLIYIEEQQIKPKDDDNGEINNISGDINKIENKNDNRNKDVNNRNNKDVNNKDVENISLNNNTSLNKNKDVNKNKYLRNNRNENNNKDVNNSRTENKIITTYNKSKERTKDEILKLLK